MVSPIRRSTPTLLLVLLAIGVAVGASRPAAADFPEDLDVRGLGTLDSATAQRMFDYVVQETAMIISPKALSPGETLGTWGFEIGLENTLAFPHTTADADENMPTWDMFSAWDMMTASGIPSPGVVYIPSLRLRKGLPYSFEVGATAGWILNTKQGILGVNGRWAPQEGWPNVPDVALSWGYNGLVGNDTLDLGVFEFDLTVGYTFNFGLDRKYTSARFSPFAGVGFLTSHAKAKNVDFDLLPVTGWGGKAEPGVVPADFRYTKIFVGFTLVANQFQFGFDGELIPKGVHTINLRIGVNY
jgi:hypothetical protein